MKQKRIVAVVLALLLCALMGASAWAATQSGTHIWVGYNAKYTFYLHSVESGGRLVRIDANNKAKTIYTRSVGLWNIFYCDDRYVYVTGETDTRNFKTLPSDAAYEESQYGVIHVDIIRVDVETGKAKTIKSNIPNQIPEADANYLYYRPDGANMYRMKHDGTGAQKYMEADDYYSIATPLANGNTYQYNWNTDKTTIRTPKGTTKTISGFPYAAGSYLFVWEHLKTDDEYCVSLFRYDLNGNKKTAITSMQNRYQVQLAYGGGALYFAEETGETGYVVRKLTLNGKLTTVLDRSKQDTYDSVYIAIAGDWLFLYDDVDSNGQWGQYISKHKIATAK